MTLEEQIAELLVQTTKITDLVFSRTEEMQKKIEEQEKRIKDLETKLGGR